MASKQSTVEFIADQVSGAGLIRFRKMFGEYALYCNEKPVAFICDDKLFVKPTEQGIAFAGFEPNGQAYPGSKLYLQISEDYWDNKDWLTNLIATTAAVLPIPKPKKKKLKSSSRP